MNSKIHPSSDTLASIPTSVQSALGEDIGAGDLTAALVPATQRAQARVLVRHDAIICGTAWFDEVFRQIDSNVVVEWHIQDGDKATENSYLCTINGLARSILSGERTALNFLQTLSGTATTAHEYSQIVSEYATEILDTRKTIPGLRLAQKYAVRTGGASNHRIGLFDAILIKENHIVACGGVAAAIKTARAQAKGIMVEVEVENLNEAKIAIEAGPDRVMLDDFNIEDMRVAIEMRDEIAPEIKLEASGGITKSNLATIAALGIDFISIGSLTKHLRATDLSMRFEFLSD